MGYDETGKQNFKYALASCKLSAFCMLLRAAMQEPGSDILYARGGANSVRTWKAFSRAIRPLDMLKGMRANSEGIWIGSGNHISYLHQDAHFNFFAMVTGTKRVLLYPLEAIGDLYPSPFFGGIAGTTSSFIRPAVPDEQRFPRFRNAEKQAWVAILEQGDLLCLPPCWWHYVEAGPGLNLMVNAFVWALPPRTERRFEVMMRNSITTALSLSREELFRLRDHLYRGGEVKESIQTNWSRPAAQLYRSLSQFLQPGIPLYWRRISRCYYDHYVFQLNGHPVPSHPELYDAWLRQQSSISRRQRDWLRFNRDLLRMTWRRRTAKGIVP
jgi:hypothetical protein